jgi:hypothetical protein
MPLPNLIHPVPVVIRQIDKANTAYDEEYREPIQRVARRNNTTLPGQVKWANDKRVQYTRGGNRYDADGYVLFRYVDLASVGITLNINDRFMEIGGLAVDVYIKHFQPQGHYPDAGGPTLVKAFFGDKDPAKQS